MANPTTKVSILVLDAETKSMEAMVLQGAWTRFGQVVVIPWRDDSCRTTVARVCRLQPRVLILGQGLGTKPFVGQQLLDQLLVRGFKGQVLVCAQDRFMVAPTAVLTRVKRDVHCLTAALQQAFEQ